MKTPEQILKSLLTGYCKCHGDLLPVECNATLLAAFEDAQCEARAEALEEAAAKAEEYATTGSSHKATVIAKAIRELAKARP